MRIELNASGLGGSAVCDFQLDMSKFIDSFDEMIDSFEAVKRRTYNLNCGVLRLSGALECIERRISCEEEQKENIIETQNKSNEFIRFAGRIDEEVAELVDQNKEAFYQANPWLRPPKPQQPQSWAERGWDALCDFCGEVVDACTELFESVGSALGDFCRAIGSTFKDFMREALPLLKEAFVFAANCFITGATILIKVREELEKWYESSILKNIVDMLKTTLKLTCDLVATGFSVGLAILAIIGTDGLSAPVMIPAAVLSILSTGIDFFDAITQAYPNDCDAIIMKIGAYIADAVGEHDMAQQLREEAIALGNIDSWRDIWYNDGVFDAGNVIGMAMDGIQFSDFIFSLITPEATDFFKVPQIISVIDTIGTALSIDEYIEMGLAHTYDKIAWVINNRDNIADTVFTGLRSGINVIEHIYDDISDFMDNIFPEPIPYITL